MNLDPETHGFKAPCDRPQTNLAEEWNAQLGRLGVRSAHDSVDDRIISWYRLASAIRHKIDETSPPKLLLSLSYAVPECGPVFLVSYERLGGHDALIPEMAYGRGCVTVLEMNELPVLRKEVAWFKIRTLRTFRRELELVEIEKVVSVFELPYERAFVFARDGRTRY